MKRRNLLGLFALPIGPLVASKDKQEIKSSKTDLSTTSEIGGVKSQKVDTSSRCFIAYNPNTGQLEKVELNV